MIFRDGRRLDFGMVADTFVLLGTTMIFDGLLKIFADGLRRFLDGLRLRAVDLVWHDKPRQFDLLAFVLFVGGSEDSIEQTMDFLACRRSTTASACS